MFAAESALRGGMNFNGTTLVAEYKAKRSRSDSMGSNHSGVIAKTDFVVAAPQEGETL